MIKSVRYLILEKQTLRDEYKCIWESAAHFNQAMVLQPDGSVLFLWKGEEYRVFGFYYARLIYQILKTLPDKDFQDFY